MCSNSKLILYIKILKFLLLWHFFFYIKDTKSDKKMNVTFLEYNKENSPIAAVFVLFLSFHPQTILQPRKRKTIRAWNYISLVIYKNCY